MTQIQRYLDDTYCFFCTSEIIAIGSDDWGNWFILKENIFHPQGGGQPSDIGWVNDISVKIRKQPTSSQVAIYPELPLRHSLGDKVISKVSVADRISHAALHTTGHLLNWELRQYGWLATKGHHFPGESRVEFSPTGDQTIPLHQLPLQDIEAAIRIKLSDGKQVKTWYEGDIRLCLIEGTEPAPCAGTHVDNLKKINEFSIKSTKVKKGILRISYDASHIFLRSDHAS
ncbi:hypothetical protein [Xenorhabdus sp. TH1]|uniref:hypothetical protein n=1 Tax=Xenorhabdus sp. TH1 TaxID=3130166 RepID=UPI0030CBB7EC